MNLTFKMTGEEYYYGWKYKCKKGKVGQNILPSLIILPIFVIIYSVFFNQGYVMYLFAAGIILLNIFKIQAEKKSVIAQFNISPIKSGEHTLRIYDEGVELINGYEKVFAPWQSIFAVKETKEYLIILPSFSRGIAVISKQKYEGPELENIVNKIKSNIKVEEGKR